MLDKQEAEFINNSGEYSGQAMWITMIVFFSFTVLFGGEID